jgi:hypothetical protein
MAFSNGPRIITQGLNLLVDIADLNSYPGSGTVVTDIVSKVTGSFTGSVSYTSSYYGGLSFTNESSSIVFPGTTTNYGTDSFAVEMTFQPTRIQGIHWLFTKNSGSFPTWGAYISGSNNTGKVFVTYNVSSTVSCSVSSSDFITTGSTYISTFRYSPFLVGTYSTPVAGITMVINNGFVKGGVALANNTGTLGTTASLFVGNTNTLNRAFSGSIHNFKVYRGTTSFSQPGTNYAAQYFRYNLPQQSPATRFIRSLIVGPGGGAGIYTSYGGGGGGAVIEAYTTVNIGRNQVIVGAGGETAGRTALNGSDTYLNRTSSFSDIVAIGGGNGATGGSSFICPFGGSGSSGGGGNPSGQAALYNGIYYGFNGGSGSGGGGGGAGGPANGVFPGPGLGSDISGVLTYYGGGGAGSSVTAIAGGVGGGGGNNAYRALIGLPTQGGGFYFGMTGSANTGGGGGTSGPYDGRNNLASAAGGSGVVIIRYQGAQQGFGGTVTSVGNDTLHTFTASGDFILL